MTTPRDEIVEMSPAVRKINGDERGDREMERAEDGDEDRESILNVKRILKDYRRLNDPAFQERDQSLRDSGRVVWTAVMINATNFILKSMAWFHTGSHSLFAEAIHSLADTINQLILYFGIRKSIQLAEMC
jgi:zinc transporter 9